MNPGDKNDFAASVATTLRDAYKLKKQMLARGVRNAWTLCPECGGRLRGQLARPNNHMRFWCEGPCGRQLME